MMKDTTVKQPSGIGGGNISSKVSPRLPRGWWMTGMWCRGLVGWLNRNHLEWWTSLGCVSLSAAYLTIAQVWTWWWTTITGTWMGSEWRAPTCLSMRIGTPVRNGVLMSPVCVGSMCWFTVTGKWLDFCVFPCREASNVNSFSWSSSNEIELSRAWIARINSL